ncbi:TatD family hydrolase, partial [Pseudomonadota bacterium]|nr:TatD family hydrolase [Pseudomonadota bacterium]
MHLIDSHCHLDFTIFDTDRDHVISRCNDLDVKSIIIPAVTASSWQRLLSVCAQSEILHPALGLHPMFMQQHKPEHIDELKDAVKQHKHTLVAIGEIGLDFYLPDHDKQAQTELFIEQLKVAQDTELPVLLHVRKAHDQALSCLKKYPVSGGIVHAFNGSIQQAEHYQKLGFLFGVGGAITHSNAT